MNSRQDIRDAWTFEGRQVERFRGKVSKVDITTGLEIKEEVESRKAGIPRKSLQARRRRLRRKP